MHDQKYPNETNNVSDQQQHQQYIGWTCNIIFALILLRCVSFFLLHFFFVCASLLFSWVCLSCSVELVIRFHFLFSFLLLYLFYMFIYGRCVVLVFFLHCRRQRRTCREMYLDCVIMFAMLYYFEVRRMFVYMLLSLFTFDHMKFHAFLFSSNSLLLFTNGLRAVEQIGHSVLAL